MLLHIYSNIFPIFVHNLGSLVDGTKSCMSKHMVSLSLGLCFSHKHIHQCMRTYTHTHTETHGHTNTHMHKL